MVGDVLTYIGEPYILRAIIAIILISINAALTGSFTIFKDVSFLVAGSSHAALAGAALAIFLDMYGILHGIDPIIGGIIFAIITALTAGYASRKGEKEQVNTAIGIAFAMSMALAVLIISLIREYAARAWGLLFGDLLLLTNTDIFLMAITTGFVVLIVLIFYKEFLFISFDMEGAMAYGVRATTFNYLLMIIIAISVVIIMKGVGTILVFAMLVAPAAAGNEVAKSVKGVMVIAFIITVISGIFGLLASFVYPFSPGAIAALTATTIYFVSIAFKRR